MRVQIVDPAAQTPPFDRALSAALARAGAQVELVTSEFVHGPVADPEGYEVAEIFYPRSSKLRSGSLARRALLFAEHVPSMARARRGARGADVVNYQWLTVPGLDARLLPPKATKLLTIHELPRTGEGRRYAGIAAAIEQMDGLIVLTEHGAARLRDEMNVPANRVHVVPHGAFDYLTKLPEERPLLRELEGAEGPVILSFGLIRPYKGVDVLLRAFAELDSSEAELWIVGRPLGVDVADLHRLADAAKSRVRFVTRFITDPEIPAIFRRADVIALPYREAQQSGVLYAALAFGKAIVASDVGGFREVGATGEGETLRLVPPEDPSALATALGHLIGDDEARSRLASAAARAAAGPYSWDAVAAQTLALYGRLSGK